MHLLVTSNSKYESYSVSNNVSGCQIFEELFSNREWHSNGVMLPPYGHQHIETIHRFQDKGFSEILIITDLAMVSALKELRNGFVKENSC